MVLTPGPTGKLPMQKSPKGGNTRRMNKSTAVCDRYNIFKFSPYRLNDIISVSIEMATAN